MNIHVWCEPSKDTITPAETKATAPGTESFLLEQETGGADYFLSFDLTDLSASCFCSLQTGKGKEIERYSVVSITQITDIKRQQTATVSHEIQTYVALVTELYSNHARRLFLFAFLNYCG